MRAWMATVAVRRHCRGAQLACRHRGRPRGRVRRRAAACGRTRDGRLEWPPRRKERPRRCVAGGELDGDGKAARGATEREP